MHLDGHRVWSLVWVLKWAQAADLMQAWSSESLMLEKRDRHRIVETMQTRYDD